MTTTAEDPRKNYSAASKSVTEAMNNNKIALYSQLYGTGHMSKHHREPIVYSRNPVMANNNSVEALTDGMNRMNLPAPYSGSDKFSRSVSGQSYDGGVTMNTNIPHAFMYNGQIMFPSNQLHPNVGQCGHGVAQPTAIYTAANAQYLNQHGIPYGHVLNGHSPLPSTWPNSRVPSGEMPSLITPRRDSSSSQENDAPGTPFNHYGGFGEYSAGVAVIDRSPHSMYAAWSTPSPPQNYKAHYTASISPRLQLLIRQEPGIPRAVPAPYSPAKPLDRSLENVHGVTNVYIRGLLPDTTDEMLQHWANRFGDIVSSKSIIDHTTGKCKGFGFVKYHSFKDAEDCIRGFHSLGYETSFARESFYSQLKKLADDTNTNLYVSNLPKDMNEHEMSALFGNYKVCSSRILRDSSGNGRGVGFARFESRDACEDVIKHFDKTKVTGHDGQEYIVQIRYADTQDQKSLKQQTTAARQYRTAEYESQTGQRTNWPSDCRLNGVSDRSGTADNNDFERYLANTTERNSSAQNRGSFRDRMSNASSNLNTVPNTFVNASNSCSNATPPETRVATVESGVKFDGKTENHKSLATEHDSLEASS